MTLDERARRATDELLVATRGDVNVRVALDRLQHGRHSLARATLAGLAVLVLLAAAFGVVQWSTEHMRSSSPAVVAPTATTHVALAVPFSVVLPPGWSKQVHGNAQAVLYGRDGSYLEVVMDPSPAAPGSAAPKLLTAESLARWIAARPDLVEKSPVTTTVAGQPAWQIDLVFSPVAAPSATCDGPTLDCLPLIRVPGVPLPLGLADSTAGRITIIQLASGRLMAVSAGGDSQHHLEEVVAAVQPVMDSLTFDHP
jgi:hypothetical protein